jgi:hypothetical protein
LCAAVIPTMRPVSPVAIAAPPEEPPIAPAPGVPAAAAPVAGPPAPFADPGEPVPATDAMPPPTPLPPPRVGAIACAPAEGKTGPITPPNPADAAAPAAEPALGRVGAVDTLAFPATPLTEAEFGVPARPAREVTEPVLDSLASLSGLQACTATHERTAPVRNHLLTRIRRAVLAHPTGERPVGPTTAGNPQRLASTLATRHAPDRRLTELTESSAEGIHAFAPS